MTFSVQSKQINRVNLIQLILNASLFPLDKSPFYSILHLKNHRHLKGSFSPQEQSGLNRSQLLQSPGVFSLSWNVVARGPNWEQLEPSPVSFATERRVSIIRHHLCRYLRMHPQSLEPTEESEHGVSAGECACDSSWSSMSWRENIPLIPWKNLLPVCYKLNTIYNYKRQSIPVIDASSIQWRRWRPSVRRCEGGIDRDGAVHEAPNACDVGYDVSAQNWKKKKYSYITYNEWTAVKITQIRLFKSNHNT